MVRAQPVAMMHPRSINSLLSLVFLFFLLLVAVLGLFSIQRLSEFNRAAAGVRDVWLPNTRLIGDLNNYTSDFRAAEGRVLLSSTPEQAEAARHEIEEVGAEVGRAQTDYEARGHATEASGLYKRFAALWSTYRGVAARVIALQAAGDAAGAVRLYGTESQAAYKAASDALENATRLNIASAVAASDESDAAYRSARNLIILAMAIGALLVVAALTYVNRYISVPLRRLAFAMRRLARNDTDIAIDRSAQVDEIREMTHALTVFRTNAIELTLSQRSLSQQASMLEERLAQERRLTERQQDFVSMASHEFRTPLTVIDAQAQRLGKIASRILPDDVRERAARIRKAVLRMTTTMEHLLSSARLTDGNPELYFHPGEVDLRGLLEEVCQVHREIAPQGRIWQKFGSGPMRLRGDGRLLSQAFGNLISNAMKYSPDGSLIDVVAASRSDAITVSVTDRGIGIPSPDLPHIFERYARGSNVSGIVGTGVGLYFVKVVVDLHGGTVEVASREGAGASFTVTLPVVAVDAATAEPPQGAVSRPVPEGEARDACATSPAP